MAAPTEPQAPRIIMGYGASDPDYLAPGRVEREHLYRPMPYVVLMPVVGGIPPRVHDAIVSLAHPPNQPHTQLTVEWMEVGAAYNLGIAAILEHPVLSTWRYLITIEQDNLVPPYALVDLMNEAEGGGWDVLGGLYHTKGEGGFAQIWGKRDEPLNFVPQRAVRGEVVPTWGTGMGCTVFRLDVFKRLPGPWFNTRCNAQHGSFTQDLDFFKRAHDEGLDLKVGVDCRVIVGHLDVATGQLW